MARLARTAFLATLLTAAVALAACGGGGTENSNRYVRELTAAQTTYQETAERLEDGATTTSTPQQDRRTLDRFAEAINDTIVTLRRIKVPAAVVAEHRRFVEVFVTWHDSVARFVAAIKNNPTRRGIQRAERRIALANQTFNASVREAGTDIDAKLAA